MSKTEKDYEGEAAALCEKIYGGKVLAHLEPIGPDEKCLSCRHIIAMLRHRDSAYRELVNAASDTEDAIAHTFPDIGSSTSTRGFPMLESAWEKLRAALRRVQGERG